MTSLKRGVLPVVSKSQELSSLIIKRNILIHQIPESIQRDYGGCRAPAFAGESGQFECIFTTIIDYSTGRTEFKSSSDYYTS
jgi:hypothetical protein